MVLLRLKEIRESRELSFEDLAELSGVSHMTIRRAEKGRGIILSNAKMIAKALHVKMGELTGEGDR